MHWRPKGVKLRSSSLATCNPEFSWMSNTNGDDPCKIASVLLEQCNDDGDWDVFAIPAEGVYSPPPPSQANACQCNTVTYSLLSACAACQRGLFESFQAWAANCPHNVVTRQTFPNDTKLSIDVPSWAYYTLTISGHFDIARAESSCMTNVGQSNRSTASNTSFSTPSRGAPPSLVSSLTSPFSSGAAVSLNTRSSTSSSHINIAIIVIVSLIFIGLSICAFLFYKFNRRNAASKLKARGQYRPVPPHREWSQSSTSSGTVVDIRPARRPARSSWVAGLFTNFRRTTGTVAPYTPVQVPASDRIVSPPLKVFMPQMTVQPTSPPSVPSSVYGANPRPRAHIRMWTDPFPTASLRRELSRSSTLPPSSDVAEPSTSPLASAEQDSAASVAHTRSSSEPHNAIAAVTNVPRTSGWHIEDTPTVVEFPTRDVAMGDFRKPVRRMSDDPQGSVQSFHTQHSQDNTPAAQALGDTRRPRRGSTEPQGSVRSLRTIASTLSDSDSMAPLTPSPVVSRVRASPIALVQPNTRPLTTWQNQQYTPNSPRRDAVASTAGGSSPRPMSTSSKSVSDSIRYGAAQWRTKLFPASVRATGYTGVPLDQKERST